MKFICLFCLVLSSYVYALDYDPQFHTKHRYNRHKEAQAAIEQKPQKMEAPKKTSPTPGKVK